MIDVYFISNLHILVCSIIVTLVGVNVMHVPVFFGPFRSCILLNYIVDLLVLLGSYGASSTCPS